jgi:O-acetyl-ADP-ribose deacetylase (regulator of RNase III)
MLRSTRCPALVQWDVQRFTKDGRPRARRPLFGIHRKKWRERLPWPVVILTCGTTGMFLYKIYDRSMKLTPTQQFLQKVTVVPHGVLGTQLHPTGSLIKVADQPDYNTTIVDPAGLHHIHGTAKGAGGAAGAIYKWLGLEGKFSDEVRLALNVVGDAKLAKYKLQDKKLLEIPADLKPLPNLPQQNEMNNNIPTTLVITKDGQKTEIKNPLLVDKDGNAKADPIAEKLQTRNVIHAIGPDFRVGKWTDREASVALARGYRNILHEFIISETDTLRIAPLSSGIFSGPMYQQIPPLTQEALANGFEQLHQYDKEAILDPRKKIELCIFTVREWDAYCDAFDYIAPPSKL